jgi:cobalamin biosynthesis Co2+ chelatase CbiK
MQVIGNIDEKFLQSLPLNPGIEYSAIVREVHRLRVFQIELDIDMLQIHGSLL